MKNVLQYWVPSKRQNYFSFLFNLGNCLINWKCGWCTFIFRCFCFRKRSHTGTLWNPMKLSETFHGSRSPVSLCSGEQNQPIDLECICTEIPFKMLHSLHFYLTHGATYSIINFCDFDIFSKRSKNFLCFLIRLRTKRNLNHTHMNQSLSGKLVRGAVREFWCQHILRASVARTSNQNVNCARVLT